MYNTKSDYSLNKLDQASIVYRDAEGHIIRLTRENFVSEDEFLTWKRWSDDNYHTTEKDDHLYADHTDSIAFLFDQLPAVPSVDNLMVENLEQQEREQFCASALEEIKELLSATQFWRLWLHHVKGQTVREIAQAEGVGFQRVHKSIQSAEKKIFKSLKKQGDKRP